MKNENRIFDWWTLGYAGAGAATWFTGMQLQGGVRWWHHLVSFGAMATAEAMSKRDISIPGAIVDGLVYWFGGLAVVMGIVIGTGAVAGGPRQRPYGSMPTMNNYGRLPTVIGA